MSIVMNTKDPASGRQVQIYKAVFGPNTDRYAIARLHGADWMYLTESSEWLKSATFYMTEDYVKTVWDRYCQWVASQKGEPIVANKSVKYKFLPEYNHPFHLYLNEDKRWRIAVESVTEGGYYYLQQNLEFGKRNEANNIPHFGSQAVAEQICDEYLAKIKKITATPVLIDNNRAICKFPCPSCRTNHIRYYNKHWESVFPAIRVMCPRNLSDVLIQLWTPVDPKFKRANKQSPTAPFGDITTLPKWDCKECYGTGEFIGLNAVDPCQTCFPKNS